MVPYHIGLAGKIEAIFQHPMPASCDPGNGRLHA